MLIGNRWVKKTRLKILNSTVGVTPAWIPFPGAIQTNLSERGLLVGFTHFFSAAAGMMIQFQILFDGQPAHQGFFRAAGEFAQPLYMSNQQPTTMLMPHLDVPENTEVTVRAQVPIGAGFNSYIDLYVVTYYVKDWDAALPAVCFPTDVVAPGQV